MNRKLLILAFFVLGIMAQGSATVTSCDEFTFSSNSDASKLNGDKLSCSFTSDFTDDSIDISVPASEITDKFDGESLNDISVEVSMQENYIRYNFRDTGKDPVQYFQYAEQEVDIKCTDDEATVRAKINDAVSDDLYEIGGSNWYSKGKLGWGGCYREVGYIDDGQQLATVGEIDSSPNLVWVTEWKVSNGEETHTVNLSNSEIGEGVSNKLAPEVYATWTGSKTGGETAPTPTDEVILHNNEWDGNGFRVGNEDRYNEYTEAIPGLIDNVENHMEGEYGEEAVTNNINSLASEAVEPHSNSEFTDATFEGSDIGTGFLEIRNDQIRFPEFQIDFGVCQYLETGTPCDSFITVEKSVGVPEIQSITSQKFGELDTGYVDVTFENVGSSSGSFSTRLTGCGDNFAISDNSKRSALSAGESTTETFTISASSTSFEQSELTSSCSVEVEELNSGESVTGSVDVTAVQENECDPGEPYIKVKQNDAGETYDTVQECADNGLSSEQILKCSPDERAVEQDGTWQCESQGSEVNAWTVEGGTGEQQCVKGTYEVGSIPDNAYLNKGECQEAIGGGKVCLVDTVILGSDVEIGCVSESLWNKLNFIIILMGGLIGAGAGNMAGKYIDGEQNIQGKNRYLKGKNISRIERSKSNPLSTVEIGLTAVGLLIGGAIGWYVGFLGTILMIVLLLVLKYLIPGY